MTSQDNSSQNIANDSASTQEDINNNPPQPVTISSGGPEGGAKVEDDVNTTMDKKLDRLDQVMDDYGYTLNYQQKQAVDELVKEDKVKDPNILLDQIKK